MKNILVFLLLFALIIGCNSSKSGFKNTDNQTNGSVNDTVKIANDELEYEVIIIDPGFNSWLLSTARPRGYYSESYLENRNYLFITEWNNRVNQPMRYNPNLYEMRIDYDPSIHYGYEVNYLIYNYMIYFQQRNNQRLTGFVPRP
ncbi:DUF6146 family protein [Flavobacterium capsici]|uniref:DUF6146 family protein n=1 Tax=Flavobacterium capsici TaxID=3075618 RepID=A0AA96ETF5_9FLAO|nr:MULTISPECIES: DUF6146 family protein [unclassified Flavobacterium]WNM18108.1 DUF6146 family protein [Flavobacterium sp. PMR2A8]WNM22160.1 DUF6146 family protein [Flavobacterium sp. PMTSA4]